MNIPAWQYYRNCYRGTFRKIFFVILISFGQAILYLPTLLLIRYTFDRAIPSGKVSTLILIGVAIILLYLTEGGITLYIRYTVLEITKNVIKFLREEILVKFYSFSRAYYDRANRSQLHTQAVQDSERVDVMSNALVAQIIPSLFISVALSVLLLYLDWLLFLVMVGLAPFLFALHRLTSWATQERIYIFHRSFEKFSQGILFVLQIMDLTRIQAAEDLEIARQRKNIEELRLTSKNMAWLRTAYVFLQSMVLACSGIVILVVGGRAVALNQMTMGELLAFYIAVSFLKSHLATIFSCIPQIIEGSESLDSLFKLLETKAAQPYAGTRRIEFSGKISLTSVHFKYSDRLVLENVSLTVPPHTTVVIVGPNGAGKSTIINLILGFYRPQEGFLSADGHPYDDLDLVSIRRQTGVVMQNALVFRGTIWENITYGRPEATEAQVSRAAQLATAHDFIQELPRGYQTFIGENGVLLSGGQRQRVALTRALLQEPRLLILDEPTTHLDEETVQQFIRNLKGRENVPASLIISHETSLLRETDYIYILERGRIVSEGPYQKLFARETP